MKSLLVILCVSLAACCPPQLVKQAPSFDARLLEECPSLEEVNIVSFSDVLTAKHSDTKAYIACKAKHKGLVDSVKIYQKEFNK